MRVVGIFGGSFDPPHAGHLKAAETARRGFGLDRIWWMPTPQSPFKSGTSKSWLEREAMIRNLVEDIPATEICDIEARLGAPVRSWHTLSELLKRYPRMKFVWICGADSFKDMHRWERADYLEANICFAVVGRPGSRIFGCPFSERIPRVHSRMLVRTKPPAWSFIPLHEDISSTELRKEFETANRIG